MTGVEVSKSIWARKPSIKILFWCNYTEETYIHGITKIVPSAAVYGYILKSAPGLTGSRKPFEYLRIFVACADAYHSLYSAFLRLKRQEVAFV